MMAVSIYLLLNISHIRRDGCLSVFSLLYVEASNLSVYCIVKAMKCTVNANRVNSFVLRPRLVQNDCIFFSFSDVNLFLLTCFTLLESDLGLRSSLSVCS